MSLSSFPRNIRQTAFILSTASKLFVQKPQNMLHGTSTSPILRHRHQASCTQSRRFLMSGLSGLSTQSITAPSEGVRVYTNADQAPVEKLASSLASAFENDPVFLYTHGSDDMISKNKNMFLFMLNSELSRPHGETTVHVSDDYSTVAVWHHVNHWKMSIMRQILFAVKAFSVIGWGAFRFMNVFSRVEAQHPTEPHMHLFAIGTDAAMQGKGQGSIVISKMLQHCDSHGIPAYLESSNENNLRFYRKHGFKVTGKISDTPKDCPPMFTLWRDPKPIRDNLRD